MPAGRPAVFDHDELEAFIRANPTTVYREIAQHFGCSIATVARRYHDIFPDTSSPCGQRRLIRQREEEHVREERRKKKEARLQSLLKAAELFPTATYQELADYLGETLNYVSKTLKLHGMGPGYGRRRGGLSNRIDSLTDLESERCQIIRESLEQGWTLQETGQRLGVTRERVRQLQSRYRKKFPDCQPQKFISLRAAATKLRVSYTTLREIAKSQNIGRERGLSQYVFSEEEMLKLPEVYTLGTRRVCDACGQFFFRPGKLESRRHRFCSNQCRKVTHTKAYVTGAAGPLTVENSRGWASLVEAIPDDRPEETVYVSLKEACEISGATRMQLIYLRYRGVVRTKDHPTRSRNGVPHKLYSLSDVQIVKQYVSA